MRVFCIELNLPSICDDFGRQDVILDSVFQCTHPRSDHCVVDAGRAICFQPNGFRSHSEGEILQIEDPGRKLWPNRLIQDGAKRSRVDDLHLAEKVRSRPIGLSSVQKARRLQGTRPPAQSIVTRVHKFWIARAIVSFAIPIPADPLVPQRPNPLRHPSVSQSVFSTERTLLGAVPHLQNHRCLAPTECTTALAHA